MISKVSNLVKEQTKETSDFPYLGKCLRIYLNFNLTHIMRIMQDEFNINVRFSAKARQQNIFQ